ncbi:MAG: hypothetical protein U0136_00435 [Bdellovibrionota bacterium]
MYGAPADADETFEQEVHFNFTPGLTGELELNHPDLHIERVRALLTIDDRLLVIPLQSLGSGKFRGVFPTPSKQFRYQYQFFRDNHEVSLSNRYSVEQGCGPDFEARGAVGEAIELDQEIERLRASEKLVAGLRGIQ